MKSASDTVPLPKRALAIKAVGQNYTPKNPSQRRAEFSSKAAAAAVDGECFRNGEEL
jgi:hypothetical protein